MNSFPRALRRTFFPLLCFLLISLAGCDKAKSLISPRIATPHPGHPAGNHTPRLAIILDDVGSDAAALDAIFALPYPLTLSVLPNHPHSTEIAEEAHRRGYQVMLHLPMESEANETPEVQQLRSGMSPTEISQILNGMLQSVPHADGVNNHQGSLATSDSKLMEELMPLLRARKLFFVDSRTTTATVAFDTAERDGVRSDYRNVPFLDEVPVESAIRQQLERAIHGAKEKGEAIVIGHPHRETLRVLRQMLPLVQSQGVQLVHASDLVR